MKIILINDTYIICKYDENAGIRFKVELSRVLKDRFGIGYYPEQKVKDALQLCLHYFSNQFESICQAETSFTFYKSVFTFNEAVTEFIRLFPDCPLPPEIEGDYLPFYRRVLKLILEQACSVKMVSGETITEA